MKQNIQAPRLPDSFFFFFFFRVFTSCGINHVMEKTLDTRTQVQHSRQFKVEELATRLNSWAPRGPSKIRLIGSRLVVA